MKMMNVLRLTMTVDIPIDNPGQVQAVTDASTSASAMIETAKTVGHVESKVHFQRVRVPEGEPETDKEPSADDPPAGGVGDGGDGDPPSETKPAGGADSAPSRRRGRAF